MKVIGDIVSKFWIFIVMAVVGLGIFGAIQLFIGWNSGMSMADNKSITPAEQAIWKGIIRYCVGGNDEVGIYACALYRDKLVDLVAGQVDMAVPSVEATEASQLQKAAKAAGPILQDLKETLGDKESM